MENDFLKRSKTVQDNTKTIIDQTDHIEKTFCDVLTQTQSILYLDKVYFSKNKKNSVCLYIYIFFYVYMGA